MNTLSMQGYILSARARDLVGLADLQVRRSRAMAVAKLAANVLRADFGASQVALFGSVVGECSMAAFSLQNFYMGTERIFEEVAKQVDNFLPSGRSSHSELLEQMSLEVVNIRPAVILADTLDRLQEYRGFRHVAVHLYAFELRADRISELVGMLSDCRDMLSRNVAIFCEFLLVLEKNA